MTLEHLQQTPEHKEQITERNLLTEPIETVEAMARLEGPGWLAQQEDVQERLAQEHITDGVVIEEIAHNTLAAALFRLQNLPTMDLTGGPHLIYTIYGAYGVNRWYVYSDGVVKLSKSHALDNHVDFAQEQGFELAS